jgi:hypothetical protein
MSDIFPSIIENVNAIFRSVFRTSSHRTCFLIFSFLCLSATFTEAQTAVEDSLQQIIDDEIMREEAISVFLDCPACDLAYIRQEITFVNYVRDPQLAQVHVFVTDQMTGSGGRTFTISFLGRGEFEDINNNLSYTALQTHTADEVRSGLATMLKLGLVPYVAHTPFAKQLSLTYQEMHAKPLLLEDKWSNWIIEVYGGGNFSKEARKSSFNIRYGMYANRITDLWRIRTHPYFNFNKRTFVQGNELITSILHRNGLDGSIVRSLTDHWSAGLFTNILSSNFSNIALSLRIAPALEYSLLPYVEATRREITASYSVGYLRRYYLEETLYDKMNETLLNHNLSLAVRIRQPWGAVFVQLQGSQFFHDLSKNRIEFDSNVSIRIVKGLSVNSSANFEIIHDQLSLPKGGASLEDVLLQQKQLSTTFHIYWSVGLSYTFGSIYNNIVNTRL